MTRAANPERGEIVLTLDGADYVLRLTYEAAVAIEAETGRSLIDLARAAERQELPLADAAVVATECIRAWGREIGRPSIEGVSTENIARLIFADGLLATVLRLRLVLVMAMTGGTKKADSDEGDDAGEATPTGQEPRPVGD